MIEAVIEKLILMKLHGMAEGLREQLNTPAYRDLGFEERFGLLVDKEKLYRENRQLKALSRRPTSGTPPPASRISTSGPDGALPRTRS